MSQVKLSWTAPANNIEVAGYLVSEAVGREIVASSEVIRKALDRKVTQRW